MKCISVSQPFADLIVTGKKTVELRNWNTKFRGEVLIHAPIKIRVKDCKRLKTNKQFDTGVIIGKVEIYDVKIYKSQKEVNQDKKFHLASKVFQNKTYGFLLRKPRMLNIPIPWKGQLGLFDVSLPKFQIKKRDIITEIVDEESRYQWIGHH